MEAKYKDIRDDQDFCTALYMLFSQPILSKKNNWKIKDLDVINASKAGRF